MPSATLIRNFPQIAQNDYSQMMCDPNVMKLLCYQCCEFYVSALDEEN